MSSRVISVIIKWDGSQAESGVKRLSGSTGGLEKQLSSIGSKMNTLLIAKLIEVGKAAFDSAAAFEQQKTSLTTLMGSADKAAAMLGNLQKFAAATPFTMPTLLQGTNTMKAFGIETSKITTYLQQLGDISLGDAQKFQSLTLAFSQVQSTGRLMGQDLLQMINVGFNPLTEISKKTGKSMLELKADMEQGKISAEMVAGAFASATAKGGQFYGALKSQSQTVSGIMSTLSDNIGVTARNFGDRFLPFVKEGLTELNNFFDSINNNKEVMQTMNTIVLGLVTAFDTWKETFRFIGEKLFPVLDEQAGKITASFKKLVGENTKANTGFTLLGGIVKTVGSGFAIAGTIVGGFIQNVINLATAVSNSVSLLGKFGEAMADPLNSKKWEAVGEQGKKTLDSFAAFGSGMVNTVGDVIKTVNNEIKTWNTDVGKESDILAQKYADNLAKMQKANAELAASNAATSDILNEPEGNKTAGSLAVDKKLQKEWTETISTEIQNRITKINEQRDAFIAGGINATEVNAWAEKEITRVQAEESQKRLENIAGYVSQYSGMLGQMLGSIGQIQQNRTDEELYQIGQKYDAQREAIESSVKDEDEKNKQLAALDKKRADEERAVKLKAFNQHKMAATGQAVISGIAAAVESFKNGGGFPKGLIPMVASIATTGLQIAAIQSQTPKFEQGGSFITTKRMNFGGATVGDNPGSRELVTVEPLSSYGTNTANGDTIYQLPVQVLGLTWDIFLAASKDGRLKIHETAIQRR